MKEKKKQKPKLSLSELVSKIVVAKSGSEFIHESEENIDENYEF